jgi:hypothetical protein
MRSGIHYRTLINSQYRNSVALTAFAFSSDETNSQPVTMDASMIEANFSGKGLGVSGATMLSAFLPKCT